MLCSFNFFKKVDCHESVTLANFCRSPDSLPSPPTSITTSALCKSHIFDFAIFNVAQSEFRVTTPFNIERLEHHNYQSNRKSDVSGTNTNKYNLYLPSTVFITQVLVGPSKQLKQIIQIQHKLLRIPTGGRQTSWLFTRAAEKLNSGLPRTKSVSGQNGIWTRDLRISNPTL